MAMFLFAFAQRQRETQCRRAGTTRCDAAGDRSLHCQHCNSTKEMERMAQLRVASRNRRSTSAFGFGRVTTHLPIPPPLARRPASSTPPSSSRLERDRLHSYARCSKVLSHEGNALHCAATSGSSRISCRVAACISRWRVNMSIHLHTRSKQQTIATTRRASCCASRAPEPKSPRSLHPNQTLDRHRQPHPR